jgi:hypothetical protein
VEETPLPSSDKGTHTGTDRKVVEEETPLPSRDKGTYTDTDRKDIA